MQQAIETPVALEYRSGDLVVVARQRLLKIQHRDGGLRGAARADLGVHRFELGRVAAQQDDLGLVLRAGERHGAPDAGAGPGDGDDAPGELRGRGQVRTGIE